MISLPSGTRIWLVAGVTDMRKSFNGLGEQVQHVLNDNPFSGHLFIFRGRRGDTIKILWADADGLCLFTKRLEEGQFIWPAVRDGKISITRSEKLRREVEQAEALLKRREQNSDRYSGREDDPQVPRQLRQSRHRRPLPAHLPREINRLEPEESCCPECGGELDYLGEVSAEQLELVSSALKVIRTERVKKACTKCDCIVEAPAPSRPIARGVAGPGLLARVLTGKYCEHLPLYRQSEIFARQGVELSRALLSKGLATTGDECRRI